MRKSRFLIAAAAVVVALGAGLTVASRSDTAEAAVVWNEDFNGAAGTGVDSSKWNYDTGGSGFGSVTTTVNLNTAIVNPITPVGSGTPREIQFALRFEF